MDLLFWLYYSLWHSSLFQLHCESVDEALPLFGYSDCPICPRSIGTRRHWINSLVPVPEEDY